MNRKEQVFRDVCLIMLIVDTRIKVSEVIKLKRKHFDLKHNHLLLDNSFKHPRILHFRKQLNEILKEYWEIVDVKNEDDFAFYTLGLHGPHQKKPITRCALNLLVIGGIEALRKIGGAKRSENSYDKRTLRMSPFEVNANASTLYYSNLNEKEALKYG